MFPNLKYLIFFNIFIRVIQRNIRYYLLFIQYVKFLLAKEYAYIFFLDIKVYISYNYLYLL